MRQKQCCKYAFVDVFVVWRVFCFVSLLRLRIVFLSNLVMLPLPRHIVQYFTVDISLWVQWLLPTIHTDVCGAPLPLQTNCGCTLRVLSWHATLKEMLKAWDCRGVPAGHLFHSFSPDIFPGLLASCVYLFICLCLCQGVYHFLSQFPLTCSELKLKT